MPDEHHDAASTPGTSAKAEVRRRMRAMLAAMDTEERRLASNAACIRLVELESFQHASTVMLYMPLADEVDTTPIAIRCFEMSKSVCVPRVDWHRRDMHAVEAQSFDDHFMETDEHGIRTPRKGRLVVPSSIDLVVVPGLAFDDQGGRLGRGGGYYDRFLGRLRRSAAAIGLAFDAQVIDTVPLEEGDMRVDRVVTDRRVTGNHRSRSRR